MKIKGVSVSADFIAEKVTDHARKLGIIKSNEELKFKEIEVSDKLFDYTFERKEIG